MKEMVNLTELQEKQQVVQYMRGIERMTQEMGGSLNEVGFAIQKLKGMGASDLQALETIERDIRYRYDRYRREGGRYVGYLAPGAVNTIGGNFVNIEYDANLDMYRTPAGNMSGNDMKNFFMRQIGGDPKQWFMKPRDVNYREQEMAGQIGELTQRLCEQDEILKRIGAEPLICYTIERISKDKKFAYVKKGDTELRIEACKDLDYGDEVLLHPKSFQIVERIGRPPLEASRFSPDSPPSVTWDDIGGLEDAKRDMIEAIEMPHTHKELFKFYNQPNIKGILLSGPPGCGKTMLGKAAANSLSKIYGKEGARTGFLYVKGPEILDQYVGQTERCIRDMFFDARRHKDERGYPAVIFLDEADAILAARGTRNVGIGNTIVPQFLTEMDGLEESGAIVIIATNRPDVLDPAIVRDGRIDRKVAVTRPRLEDACTIIELNLSRTKLSEQIEVKHFAQQMAEMIYSDESHVHRGVLLRDIVNGAMLANCVNIAVSHAIRRDMAAKKQTGIIIDDVCAAIERIRTQSVGVLHELEAA